MAPSPELVEHRRSDANPVAMLFIHGFSGDPSVTWGKFPEFLKSEPRLNGWDIYSLGYHTGLGLDITGIWKAKPDLATLAELLFTRGGLAPLNRYDSIALIAHSMGGLVVQRAVLDNSAFCDRVGHILLYGTPSGGLRKASFFKFWQRALRDMGQSSDFIKNLRSGWEKSFGAKMSFKFASTGGDEDQFVSTKSCLDPFRSFADVELRVVRGDHLSIVKPQNAGDPAVQIAIEVLTGGAAPSGPADAARMAVEMRKFQKAIKLYQDHPEALDEGGLVEYALALESVGRREEAIQVLQKRPKRPEYTDAMGVLAGRLKRRWLVERRAADADQACELYETALAQSEQAGKHSQAFYHGINVAFMQLAYRGQKAQALATAQKVLAHCAAAERDKWRLATEGEANLLLGNTVLAMERYSEAAKCTPSPRECDSMLQQAIRVASLTGNVAAAGRLQEIFRGR